MNAVNLLPAKHRPRTPTGGQQGSAYVVVGVLGALLLMVVFYVLTVNGVNGNKGKVAEAKAATARAEARAAELGPYGNFSQVKQQRVQSVKQLADGRIDWERLTRGLARVLPNNVWLLSASASASGTPSASGSGSPETPSGSAATQGAAGPKVQLSGCAPSHPAVAITLVRLRELAGAQDVQLNEISRPEAPSGATPAQGAAGATDSDCGMVHGKPAVKWDAIVSFDKAGTTSTSVPKSLGGGA